MLKYEWQFVLDDQSIEQTVGKIYELVVKYIPSMQRDGVEMKGLLQVLINNQDHFGSEHIATAKVSNKLGRVHIYIEVKGDYYDPRLIAQDEISEDSTELLSKYTGLIPVFRYSRGTNIFQVDVKVEKKLSSIARMGIGVLAGAILGLLGMLLPEGLRGQISIILTTFNGIILDIIVMSATFVVFLMVVNSIAGFGSADSLMKSGKVVIKQYLKEYLLVIVLLIIYMIFGFRFNMSTGGDMGDSLVSIITETVANIFPSSYLIPFVNCDFLQIIFIAAVVGLALLIMGERAKSIYGLFVDLEALANQIMNWFCELLPLFIFTMVPGMIWGNLLGSITGALIQLGGILLLSAIAFVSVLIIASKAAKKSVGESFKLVFPAVLQGFMTCSSTASLPKIQESIKNFEVKDSFNNLVTAFGFIFEIASSIIAYFIMTFYLMVLSGSMISPSIIVSLMISCILMSLASPPVSGGVAAIALILAGMFGVPDEYLTVLAPIMIIYDFFGTATRCGGIVLIGVISAEKLGEIEDETVEVSKTSMNNLQN